jgi:hypothetical protein
MGARKDFYSEFITRYNKSGPAGVASLYATPADAVYTDPNVVSEGHETILAYLRKQKRRFQT